MTDSNRSTEETSRPDYSDMSDAEVAALPLEMWVAHAIQGFNRYGRAQFTTVDDWASELGMLRDGGKEELLREHRAMVALVKARFGSPPGASGCQFCGGSQRVANNSPGAPDLPCPNCSAPEPSAELAPACCYAGQCDYKSPPIPRPAPEPREEQLNKAARKIVAGAVSLRDHLSSCDKTMGDTHACTCGMWAYRRLLESLDSPETKEAKP